MFNFEMIIFEIYWAKQLLKRTPFFFFLNVASLHITQHQLPSLLECPPLASSFNINEESSWIREHKPES